jgi:sulfur-carrier protein adenylyltransferase/sulfurtransferase
MRWRQFFTPVKSLNSKETRELLQNSKEDVQILDVRQPSEYQRSHIPGAQLIPLTLLGDSLDQLDRDKPIVVY